MGIGFWGWAQTISLASFYLVLLTGWAFGGKTWAILIIVLYLLNGVGNHMVVRNLPTATPQEKQDKKRILFEVLVAPAFIIYIPLKAAVQFLLRRFSDNQNGDAA